MDELLREVYSLQAMCAFLLELECERGVTGRSDEAEARQRFRAKFREFHEKWMQRKTQPPDQHQSGQPEEGTWNPQNVIPFGRGE